MLLCCLAWLGLAWAEEPAEAQRFEAYQAQRLDIEERRVSTVYAKAYEGGGSFWFVTEGHHTIGARRLALLFDDEEVQARLRRLRAARVGVGSGLMGLGVGALVAAVLVEEPEARVGLMGGGVLGVATGGVVIAQGFRRRHPSDLYGREEVRAQAEAYNAALREDLFPE